MESGNEANNSAENVHWKRWLLSYCVHTYDGRDQRLLREVFFAHRNIRRTVEVWLDEYKGYYYETNPFAKDIPFGE